MYCVVVVLIALNTADVNRSLFGRRFAGSFVNIPLQHTAQCALPDSPPPVCAVILKPQ